MRPLYALINGTKYPINTSYKIGLKCQKIALDKSIGDYERTLAIIYLIFGDKGLENSEDYEGLLEKAIFYLKCGEEDKGDSEEPNMDFEQDFDYIEASFVSDHKIDLEKIDMHWWKFMNLLNGLTENCILNRIRYIRDFDVSQIKNQKEKEKWLKQKAKFAIKKEVSKLSEKNKNSIDEFYRLTGISKRGGIYEN